MVVAGYNADKWLGDDDSVGVAEETSLSSDPTPSSDPTLSPSPLEVDEEPLDGLLRERGLTANDVFSVAGMADSTGYRLGDSSWEMDQVTATSFVFACDEVKAGEITWEESIDLDVADGAPRPDAVRMNNYLRDVFCPKLS